MTIQPFKPLTKEDVAEVLGVSIRTIENFVARGHMPPPARIGARVLWHPDVFYAWLDQTLRAGGWNDADEGEHESGRKSNPGTAQGAAKSQPTVATRPGPSVASRLQARQARLLTASAPDVA